jgi:3,4-dihydroxy 2-butanone 4-phosphate synthase / GTP cyclohydrolase II
VLDPVERAIDDIRAGQPVIVVDDGAPDNEGDLVFAAEFATTELVAFLVRHTSGYVCVSITERDADRLDLPSMFRVNQNRRGTAYTVSVDARDGVSTGISAGDRAQTIRRLADPDATAADFSRPGHILPIRARDGGVLRRAGHSEAAVDLAALAGLRPAAVLCQVVSEEDAAHMARLRELRGFASEHGLAMISVADLIAHRSRLEPMVERGPAARLPLRRGEVTAVAYTSTHDGCEDIALVFGDISDGEDVPVGVHLRCVAGDVFRSLRCDCAARLEATLDTMAREGRGVLVYIRNPEDRALALLHDLEAQLDAGDAAPPVDLERGPLAAANAYGIAAQMLVDLGVHTVRVLGDDAAARSRLERGGLSAVGSHERVGRAEERLA